MRFAALGLAALLSACGGADTATTSNPAAQNVALAAAEGTPAVVTANAECKAKPDFVPVYGDATVILCTSGAGVQPDHESGTIVYTSSASPKTVLGWSREQANASGLGQRMLTETMYSAGEATRRSIMVMVEPEGAGAKVTVNWGRDL